MLCGMTRRESVKVCLRQRCVTHSFSHTLSSASCNLSAEMLETSTSSAAGQAACSSVLSHWRPDTSALCAKHKALSVGTTPAPQLCNALFYATCRQRQRQCGKGTHVVYRCSACFCN